MDHIELLVFGLLVATAALAVLAGVLRVPYPITLVLGGLVIGFLPGVPTVELDPDIVLLIFLPPLLYGAAFFTSVRELRQNARSIAALAIPLVFVTMAAVAVVVHEVVGLGWAESFVLGAIVSPTDAVAPAEIMRRVGAPRRLVAIVEGENLTNDWTALILYRVAVAAVVSGSFTLWKAGLEFVASGIGGVIVGLAAGWLIRQVRGAVPARGPPAAGNPRRPIGTPHGRSGALGRAGECGGHRREARVDVHAALRDAVDRPPRIAARAEDPRGPAPGGGLGRRFGALEDGAAENFEGRADAWRRLMHELYRAQREALLELRNSGEISDDVRRNVERDIDLEETRIEN